MPPIDPTPSLMEMVALHLSEARPLIPMYIHLILSALFPIYTGAHASLSRPSSAAKPDKKARRKSDPEDDSEDEDKVQKMEGMSNTDAIVLPVTAGLVLMGLYFLIKWYGADLINLILGWYFAAIGVVSVAKLVNDAATFTVGFCFPTWYRDQGKLWRVAQSERKATLCDETSASQSSRSSPLPGLLGRLPLPAFITTIHWQARGVVKQKYSMKAFIVSVLDFRANVTLTNILSALFGLGTIIYVNTVSKPWFLTNLQGFAVSYGALQLMSPTTFNTGSLILAALFCYDIWAVFFTPFMVGVAKNLDQPIKLVFPRPDEPSETPGEPPIKSYSMLGLGDIVLPGIMIGLALRFDLYMFYLKKQRRVVSNEGKEDVQKSSYVSVTGKWGERFWTTGLPTAALPPQLNCTFSKTYFNASLVGYVIGMLATLGIMTVFQHAQPALLYLVPGVLLSIWGTALVRGELKQLWHFSEAVTAEQIEEEGEKIEEKKEHGKEEQSGKGIFERLWHEIWHGDEKEAGAAKKDGTKDGSDSSAQKEQKDTKAPDRDASVHDDTLVYFSIKRFNPIRSDNGEARTENSRESAKADDESPSSSSQASDDAVMVSSADVKDLGAGSEPRYRSRSVRAK